MGYNAFYTPIHAPACMRKKKILKNSKFNIRMRDLLRVSINKKYLKEQIHLFINDHCC